MTGMKELIVRMEDNGQLTPICEIVRCKNCRFGEEWGQLVSCGLMKGSHKPNWYCADGEPKDGDENETAEKVN